MPFDISAFDDIKTGELHVRHPATEQPLYDEDDNPVLIKLCGMDHPTYTKTDHAIANKRIQRGAVTRTSEQISADNVDLCAACTMGWSGIAVEDKELDFSERAAKKLYQEQKWLLGQVYGYIHDRQNFYQA